MLAEADSEQSSVGFILISAICGGRHLGETVLCLRGLLPLEGGWLLYHMWERHILEPTNYCTFWNLQITAQQTNSPGPVTHR